MGVGGVANANVAGIGVAPVSRAVAGLLESLPGPVEAAAAATVDGRPESAVVVDRDGVVLVTDAGVRRLGWQDLAGYGRQGLVLADGSRVALRVYDAGALNRVMQGLHVRGLPQVAGGAGPEPAAAGPAAMPAGWYPDPETPGMFRQWDGSGWTDFRMPAPAGVPGAEAPGGSPAGGMWAAPPAAPAPPPGFVASTGSALPPPGAAPPPVRVESWPAWLIAGIPLLALALAVGFSSGAPEVAYYSGFIALAANIAVSVWDANRIRKAGYGDLLGWAIFLIPVYLFKRQARVGQSAAPAVAWIAAFCLALAGQAMLPRIVGLPLDMPALESQIQDWVEEQLDANGFGGFSADVQCPSSMAARPGETFNCVVQYSDGTSGLVVVTVENSAGDVTWVLQ